MTALFLTAAILVLPGLALLSLPAKNKPLPAWEILVYSVPLSVTVWIAGFWLLSLLPVTLEWFIAGVLGVSLGILIAYRPRVRLTETVPALVCIALLAVPQILLMSQQIAPAGKDMSMHAYISRVILERNGFPDTMEPVVPVKQFGAYPFGFSLLTAVVSKFTGLPLLTAALSVTALSHYLFDLSVFALVAPVTGIPVGLAVTMLISWTGDNPHLFVAWGANPTVLSLALFIFGIAFFVRFRESHRIWPATFAVVGSFLTSYMPAVAGAYAITALAMVTRYRIRRLPVRGLLGFGLLLPPSVRLATMGWRLSEGGSAFVRSLMSGELAEWSGKADASFFTAFSGRIAETVGTPALALYAAYLLLLIRRRRPGPLAAHGAMWIALAALFANSRYWLLPFSPVMYPQRIIVLILVPVALGIADLFRGIRFRSPSLAAIVLIPITIALAYPHVTNYLGYSEANTVIRKGDLAAMRWLGDRVSINDTVANGYDDAGLWLPALVRVRTTLYQTNPADYAFRETYRPDRPTYAFVGSGNRMAIGDLLAEIKDATVSGYAVVYVNDAGSKIYLLDWAKPDEE